MLEEVIQKARDKGAPIIATSQSPNGRTIIHFQKKLPVFFMNTSAAADSLIHQYNLISSYRHLYQNKSISDNINNIEILPAKKESFIDSIILSAIQKCKIIYNNMDNELLSITKKKVYTTMQEFNLKYPIHYHEFYEIKEGIIEHYQNLIPDLASSQKQQQMQILIRFIDNMNYSHFKET